MLSARCLIVADNIILGGNMKMVVMKDLGYKEVPIIDVTDWSEEHRAEFLIKDNVHVGKWDYDHLANYWPQSLLIDWGLDVWPEIKEEPETKPPTRQCNCCGQTIKTSLL